MAARSHSSPVSPASALPAGFTIVVADDDPVVRRLCCRVLEEQETGVTVLEASDGEVALKLIEDHGEIDLVITDLTMPRVSGQEIAQVLSVFRPGLPVLGMSGAAHRLATDRRLPILAKPFSPSALITATRELRLRARAMRVWAEEKRSQARELCQIAATVQMRNLDPAERVDLVAVARELHRRL